MLVTDLTLASPFDLTLRALIVDTDEQRRHEVGLALQAQGVKVLGCESVEHGRALFDDQGLVVTPLNGDHEGVLEFVSWLRTRAGRIQPYVMGLGEYHAPASEWHGFNEFVSFPFSGGKVGATVDAARQWHGWNAGVTQLLQASTDEETAPDEPEESPALEVVEIFATAVPPLTVLEAPAEAKPFDWTLVTNDPVIPTPLAPSLDLPDLQLPASTFEMSGNFPDNLQPSLASVPPSTMSDGLHQQITEASPFGLLLLDDAANLIYANPQHRNILGLSVEAAGGLQGWLERGCVAEPGQQRTLIEAWYEQVWRRRLTLVMTMRSAESLLKEVEFRPSPLSEERLLVAIFDVTDARREEEAMRASEARFRHLFQQAPLGVVVVNAVGNVTDASGAFEQLVGCSRLDMRRLGMEQFLSEEDGQQLKKMAFSVRAGAAGAPVLVLLRPRQGPPQPVMCEIRIVKNSLGSPVFTAYYFRPAPASPSAAISPSMPLPAAPPSTAPPPPQLLQVVSDLMLELRADTTIMSHLPSRDFADLLPAGKLEGQTFSQALPRLAEKLPLGEMMHSLEDSLDAEVRCEFKYRLHPDEAPRFCEARLVPLAADAGAAEHRFGLLIRDLTRSHPPAESTPDQAAAAYEFSAIELLHQAAIITNEKGRICNVNPAAETLFGYPKSELLGSGLFKLFHPDQPKAFAQKISEHINRHRCWIGKSSFFRKDGTTGRVAVELVPFADHGVKGFFGLMRDITLDEITPNIPSAPATTAAPPASDVPVVTLHRTRNDLQVLTSLLSLQANDAGLSDALRSALQESKDRVGAVALVYRLLDGATGRVDFSRVAGELSHTALKSLRVADGRITIKTPSTSAHLPQKLAITLALILQEMLHSVLQNSFPGDATGLIEIKLDLGQTEGILAVKDNGLFQNEALLKARTKGFGWQIVQALSEQIRGEMKILSDLDNEMRLRFRMDPHATPTPDDH